MSASLIDQIDALIRRDPAARGLISSESLYGPLCPGHLAESAADLAALARHVAIVTGFFVPAAEPPSAETDGPPGAIVLAMAFESLGITTTLITDERCANALRAGAAAAGLNPASLTICPSTSGATVADIVAAQAWTVAFLESGAGRTLTHLIAIERVGPSHDEKSLVEQRRHGAPPLAEFLAAVPAELRNRCNNSRGIPIDAWTAPLHLLFELGPKRSPPIKTIGIGDGGNEIGMGGIPWEDLVRRLPRKESACIPCRIATDWNIIAGTSNWGGFALAAATLVSAGRTDALEPLDADFHQALLEQMAVEGPAVDGMTRRFEGTVDGLPFSTYIQAWLGIRRLLGLD